MSSSETSSVFSDLKEKLLDSVEMNDIGLAVTNREFSQFRHEIKSRQEESIAQSTRKWQQGTPEVTCEFMFPSRERLPRAV